MEEWVRIILHVFPVEDVLRWTTVQIMIFQGNLNMVSQFQVKTMAKLELGEKKGCMNFEAQRVPDHSVLMWNLALAGN